jgi:hypothetical protein
VVAAVVKPSVRWAARLPRASGAVAALIMLALAAVALATLDATVLCALPALVLSLALAMRRYPGERILQGLRASRARRPRHSRSSEPCERSPLVWMARGGLLLACSLAVRPPPGPAPAGS